MPYTEPMPDASYTPPTIDEREARDRRFLLDASFRVVENAFDLVKHAIERRDLELVQQRMSVLNAALTGHIEMMRAHPDVDLEATP